MRGMVNQLVYSLRVDTNNVFDRQGKNALFPHLLFITSQPTNVDELNFFDDEEVYLFSVEREKGNVFAGEYKGFRVKVLTETSRILIRWWIT